MRYCEKLAKITNNRTIIMMLKLSEYDFFLLKKLKKNIIFRPQLATGDGNHRKQKCRKERTALLF